MKKTTNKNKNNRLRNVCQNEKGVEVFNARVLVGKDGVVKIASAEKKTGVNQRSDWELTRSRDLARLIKRRAKENKIFVD